MALILHIESTTKNTSVAIAQKGHCISLVEEVAKDYSHSQKLYRFITYALEGAKAKLGDLDAICIDKGPGSYTGLRIGSAIAKGLCFSLNIPLLAIDSLTILTQGVSLEKAYFIAMMDARRQEVYSCVFDKDKKKKSPIEATILHEKSFESYPIETTCMFGDGALKALDILEKKFTYAPFLYPSSKDMIKEAYELFKEKKFEIMEDFEPFYLKDFMGNKL